MKTPFLVGIGLIAAAYCGPAIIKGLALTGQLLKALAEDDDAFRAEYNPLKRQLDLCKKSGSQADIEEAERNLQQLRDSWGPLYAKWK